MTFEPGRLQFLAMAYLNREFAEVLPIEGEQHRSLEAVQAAPECDELTNALDILRELVASQCPWLEMVGWEGGADGDRMFDCIVDATLRHMVDIAAWRAPYVVPGNLEELRELASLTDAMLELMTDDGREKVLRARAIMGHLNETGKGWQALYPGLSDIYLSFLGAAFIEAPGAFIGLPNRWGCHQAINDRLPNGTGDVLGLLLCSVQMEEYAVKVPEFSGEQIYELREAYREAYQRWPAFVSSVVNWGGVDDVSEKRVKNICYQQRSSWYCGDETPAILSAPYRVTRAFGGIEPGETFNPWVLWGLGKLEKKRRRFKQCRPTLPSLRRPGG